MLAAFTASAVLSGSAAIGSDSAITPAPGTDLSAAPITVRILGTAQDGGLPHTACSGTHCERARREPAFARRVASLAILAPLHGVWLVDATPDITSQLASLTGHRGAERGGVDRSPLDGVLLTHAHIGHYLGLAHLGFEAVNTPELPVYATPRMSRFLEENGPWGQLVERRNIRLVESPAGRSFELTPGVTVTPHAVPHRDEYSDTVAFRIAGPERTLLYLPDTEPWGRWKEEFLALLEGVDVALLDATFYSAEELPGRPVSSIGHPLVVDTVALLAERLRAGGLEVFFTHMNHSNPLVDPASPARRAVEAAGFRTAEEGHEFDLGTPRFTPPPSP